MSDPWRDVEDALTAAGYTLDEVQAVKALPLSLQQKIAGVSVKRDAKREAPAPAEPLWTSPNGTVWRLTINDEGKARTEKVN